jgi:short subunit dehydrogenase-like uncharacterized protein
MNREFDILLFGASGFTGKLVAEYLATRAAEEGATWALAGRSRPKVEAVRKELASIDEAHADVPIVIADALDGRALDAIVPRARVVCTTVGPYRAYGAPLARACANHGTSYCDLTGEPHFVRLIIDECHARARETKARIVHCAGFDSIPSDLGAHLAWDYAKRTHGEGLSWVKIFTGRMRGTASGGTVASGLGLIEAAKSDREIRKLLLDPHGLDPRRGVAPRDPFEDDQRTVVFDEKIGGWTAPFVMASINTRVVRRSHALLQEEDGHGYGERFRYNEAMGFSAGPKGFVRASLTTAATGALFAAAAVPALRTLLEKTVLPEPGQGPTRAQIESGFFEMSIIARTESGRRLRGTIRGTRDPGYGETAKMLGETALCLSKDTPRLAPRFGVLTPATAMGMRIVERLRAAGMTFDITDA